MNILYLSENMSKYLGASYQTDFLDELTKSNNVTTYGPGYSGFSEKKNIKDIIKSCTNKIELVIFGHTFLSDKEGYRSSIIPERCLQEKINIPKIFILNKEYVNLEFKLAFIKKNKFDLCITHHHEYKKYAQSTNTKFIFLPFAIKKDFFLNNLNYFKEYDLFFSGILQNLNINANQKDTRVRIMKKLYFSFFDLPISKRKKYIDLNIFWNSIPRNKFLNVINQRLLKNKRLTYSDYAKTMIKSRVVLNTLSPMQLISPRYFETMASKAIVLCEESSIYRKFIDVKYLITFDNNLINFDKKLQQAIELSNDSSFLNLMYKYVNKNHTWEQRINSIKKLIY